MSACRIVGGNLLARGTTTLATGTTDSNYPLTNIYDGVPGAPWRAGAAAASLVIHVDGNLVANGNFETWSDATTAGTWTESNAGTGTVTRTATAATGSYAALFTAGTVSASLYQDITVRSGEKISVKVALRSDGTGTMRAKLQNLTTGYHLTTSSTWQAASTDCATGATTSYVTTTLTPTVEVYSVTGADTCTVRLTLYCSSAGQVGYADDCYLWPYVDHASIHGHTLTNKHTVTLERSSDDSAWTSEGTMTVRPSGAFYLNITAASYRYWRIAIADATALTAPQIGEAVISQSTSLSQPWRSPSLSPAGEGEAWPQVRLSSAGGAQYARRRLDRQVASRALSWRHTDATTKEQLLDELWRRTQGGTSPCVLIPWDSEAVCLYGRVASVDVAPSRILDAAWDTALTFSEEPGPASGL